MFGKKLFQEKIEPRCVYCARGALLEEERILCPKKGVVSAGDFCGRFQYDPLKRIPPKPVGLDISGLEDEDFSL